MFNDRPFSAFLYRFRGYILGVIAIVLLVSSPSPLPKEICVNESVLGMIISVFLYVISAILRVQTRRFIGEHTRGSVHAADTLVTCGPYSCVRHPLYLSNTGFALGIAFFHLGISLRVVPFMLVFIAFEMKLARIEDRFLEKKFGDAWRSWARETPAFFANLGRFCNVRQSALHEKSRAFCTVVPQRTIWRAFFADSSTWLWLLFCNLLLVLRKLMVFYG